MPHATLTRLAAVLTLALVLISALPAQAALYASSGTITFLRINEVGTGYGPGSDFIDAEVIVKLSSQPGKAFGFQLRSGTDLATHQGMLDLLRDAYADNLNVRLEYDLQPGRNNGILKRVILQP